MGQFFEPLNHFATTVAAQAIALAGILLFLWMIRYVWPGPIDPIETFRVIIGGGHTVGGHVEEPVNVEYRASNGSNLNLGSYLTATIQNSRGRCFRLVEGCFVACDSRHIKVGAACGVSIQDGRLREEVWVQLDDQKQVLFVQSQFSSRKQISALLAKGAPSNEKHS